MEKISSLINRAADECLSDCNMSYPGARGCLHRYSCDAVLFAGCKPGTSRLALGFLRELGCQTSALFVFDEFTPGQERQSVRYAWLKFAALVAKEWGL